MNYSFEFYGTERLNGYMGNVQYALCQSAADNRKDEATSRQRMTGGQGGDNLDLYPLCINA